MKDLIGEEKMKMKVKFKSFPKMLSRSLKGYYNMESLNFVKNFDPTNLKEKIWKKFSLYCIKNISFRKRKKMGKEIGKDKIDNNES